MVHNRPPTFKFCLILCAYLHNIKTANKIIIINNNNMNIKLIKKRCRNKRTFRTRSEMFSRTSLRYSATEHTPCRWRPDERWGWMMHILRPDCLNHVLRYLKKGGGVDLYEGLAFFLQFGVKIVGVRLIRAVDLYVNIYGCY